MCQGAGALDAKFSGRLPDSGAAGWLLDANSLDGKKKIGVRVLPLIRAGCNHLQRNAQIPKKDREQTLGVQSQIDSLGVQSPLVQQLAASAPVAALVVVPFVVVEVAIRDHHLCSNSRPRVQLLH